jgi:hypothetical protein
MKNFKNYLRLRHVLNVVAGVILLNSCQKEQSLNTVDTSRQHSNPEKSKQYIINSTGIPDLTIDGARLQSSTVVKTAMFKSSDCAVAEGCVGGTGKRKLLRFDVATPNIGTADLVLGSPTNNPLFVYSPCHGHYHFGGYALYELLNLNGTTVITGRKQAFCLEDYARYDPNAGPAKFTCSNQGISVGWQDIYGSYLDCQWLDITGLPSGKYNLRVSINPEKILSESNYDNNIAMVPVTISK